MALKTGTLRALAALIIGGLLFPQVAPAARQADIVVPDRLCLPGEEIFIEAYLYRVGLMGMVRPGIQGELLEFHDARGTLLESRLTDPSGFARIRHRAARPGRFPVDVRLADNPRYRADPGSGNVFIRNKDRPFFFITLEGGLFKKGPAAPFTLPLEKETPLPGSVETVTRVAPCSTLVYLTARPMARLNRARAWLADNAFPEAPILFLASTPVPENPAGPALTTNLFIPPRGSEHSPPARLVTDDPRLASLAAENKIEVFLLAGQEENGSSKEKKTEEKNEEGKTLLINPVKGWEEIPAPCKE